VGAQKTFCGVKKIVTQAAVERALADYTLRRSRTAYDRAEVEGALERLR
jgi:hypothetical protein